MAQKITLHDLWPTLKTTASQWSEDKATKMAAALAYYSATSIAPMLVIAVWLVTRIYGAEAPDKLRGEIARLTDPQVASALQVAITRGYSNHAGTFATLISVIVAVASASGVFAELQDSLNTIWEVRPKADRGFWGTIQDRFLSMTMVLGIAFLLLVSTVLSVLLSGMSAELISQTVGSSGIVAKVVAFAVELVLSTGVITVLFAAMFKWLPDVRISWGDVWLGGFFTAILFEVGKYLLGIYIGKAAPGSAFGAVGSIVVMLIWVFYSAQILFFGAEFTQVYANKYGTTIVPAENAEAFPESNRKKNGVPRPPRTAGPAPTKPASAPRPLSTPAYSSFSYPSQKGKSLVEWGLPVFAMFVVGRFAWKEWKVPNSHS